MRDILVRKIQVLPYVGIKTSAFERNTRHIEKAYYLAKTRVILERSPMLTPKRKNPIPNEDNSCF